MLESCPWPGNVRELEIAVERAVILSRNGTLKISHDTLPAGAALGTGMDAQLETRENELIEQALRESRGRVAGPNGAARRLGVAPSTLEFRVKKLGIDKFRFRTGRQR